VQASHSFQAEDRLVTERTTILLIAVMIDLVVTAAVISFLIRKRGLLGMLKLNLVKFRAFTDEMNGVTGNYLRSNYSGNPDDLPQVMAALLDQYEQKAKEQELGLNRDALKMVLLRALQAQEGVKAGELQQAMRKVA
jgi:hypothetical protein